MDVRGQVSCLLQIKVNGAALEASMQVGDQRWTIDTYIGPGVQ